MSMTCEPGIAEFRVAVLLDRTVELNATVGAVASRTLFRTANATMLCGMVWWSPSFEPTPIATFVLAPVAGTVMFVTVANALEPVTVVSYPAENAGQRLGNDRAGDVGSGHDHLYREDVAPVPVVVAVTLRHTSRTVVVGA
jgi:hypothetical protein